MSLKTRKFVPSSQGKGIQLQTPRLKNSKAPNYTSPTISSQQKQMSLRHIDKTSCQFPSKSKDKHATVFNKEKPTTKGVKNNNNERNDKGMRDRKTGITQDKKTANLKGVNAHDCHKHQEKSYFLCHGYNDLQHQLDNTNERSKEVTKLDDTSKDQNTLDKELKNGQERCRVLEAQLLVAKNELSAKLKIIEVQRANIEDLKKEIECCRLSLCKVEEKKFKLTNDFTSAGENSVLDISNRYQHLQHNKRPAAVRQVKKICETDFKEHICNQVMCAYETAKAITLREAGILIEKCLFKMQPIVQNNVVEQDKELVQTCMILLGFLQMDESINTAAITEIKKTLIGHSTALLQRESLPPEVEDYYQSLAQLTWCAAARPIPMVIAKSPDTYCKAYHELNDDDDVEDSRAISYVYPVLYTSNKSPRELAQKGKVVLKNK